MRKAQLVGVYDANPTTAGQIAERYDTTAFDTVDHLLESVDAVTIATPTPYHFPLALRCLDYGVHALIEKPITSEIELAEQLARAAETSPLVLQVGHIERFNATFIELKKILETMPALAINFRRLSPYKGSNTDVDVVLDLMTHDLDLILDMAQRDADFVHATGLKVFSGNLDHVVVQLGYHCGPVITATASRITEQKVRMIEVTTHNAFIEADLLNKTILVHRRASGEYLQHNHGSVKYRQESIVERILVPNVEPLLSEIQHFIDCVTSGSRPNVTPADGLKALRLAQAICASTEEHPIDSTGALVPA
jgi:virulence factor